MKQLLIITGGSSGIGNATAKGFITQGWAVVNLSRRPCPTEGVVSIRVDFSKPGFIADLREGLRSHMEKAEQICLIHNAALLNKDSLHTLDTADFQRVLAISLVAPQLLNTFILPHMKAGSSILYVGSTLSEKAVPGAFSYVISKHAQLGMMRATCQDLHGSGIHTACICPGFTDTEMLNKHLNHDQDILAAVQSCNAFNRLIEPREIADVLWFAAGRPVVNGAVLHANLGQIER